MKKKYFSLSPVTAAEAPRYPVKSAVHRALRRPLMLGTAITAGAALFAGAGCTVAFEENPEVCTVGDAMCRDSDTLVFCDENHVRQVIDCDDYCVANHGEDWKSFGCNAANTDNRCQCDYDGLDGMIAQCYPEEIYCQDAEFITYCDLENGYDPYTGTPRTVTCDTYCKETMGPYYSSYLGCTPENPENLCNCEYDMIDGDIAECTPSQLLCLDDGRVAICTDSYYYEYFVCSEKCVDELGEGAISLGCDATDATDPCICVMPE